MKVCTKCGIGKELSEFRFRQDRNYLMSYCSQCEKTAKNAKRRIPLEDKKVKPVQKRIADGIVFQVCSFCGIEKIQNDNNFVKQRTGFRGDCKECSTKKQREKYHENPEKARAACHNWYIHNIEYRSEYNKEWYVNNKEYKKQWYLNNKERVDTISKLWRENNKERCHNNSMRWRALNKERHLQTMKEWRASNKHLVNELSNNRRCAELTATPPWINRLEIREIYKESQILTVETGIMHHVDHIHPLRHPFICGLNVPCNLQILTAEENQKKGNKFTPYVESEPDLIIDFSTVLLN